MKLRGILLFIILVSILFICISSINASDVNNNFNITSNELNNLQVDNNDLNNNVESLKNNSETNFENNAYNFLNNTKNGNLNVSDLVKINQTSDNTFEYKLNNATITAYRAYVYDFNSFMNVTAFITHSSSYDAILIDFKDNLNLEIDFGKYEFLDYFKFMDRNLIQLGSVKNIIIRGNNATISVHNPREYDEKHFIDVDEYHKFWMNNITIKGFNNAIENKGICQFKNVNFDSNREWYIFKEDIGAAIKNHGILKCENCTFSNNKAKNGGAIYNYKSSQSMLFNCKFTNNIASNMFDYPTPNNIAPVKANSEYIQTSDENNIYTEKGAYCLITNNNDNIYSVSINSTEDFENLLDAVKKLGSVRYLMVDFAPNITCKLAKSDDFKISFESVENLFIRGNGATISVDTKNSDECHFLKVFKGQNYQIKDLIINGFNRAIINEGSLSLINTTFNNNKFDYYSNKDYGGAIYNDEGTLYLNGCNFKNNYAKYGGAIYNNHGVLRCNICNFESNTAYDDGGAIYNYQGHLTCIKSVFLNNNAKDDGGAIYNDHGAMVLNDNIFNKSVAKDEGGAIYNDMGSITLNNNYFLESQAKLGKDLFTYGDESKYYSTNDSFVIQQVENGFTYQKLKITKDAASEAIRWTLRVTEMALCIGLCIFCTFSGMHEFTGGIIGFVGGSLLAAGEEYIENCYLDHNFNIWNTLAMAAIAGLFDGAATIAGTYIGKTFLKIGTQEATKATNALMTIIDIALDSGAEIATECIPRFDFSEFNIPNVSEHNATSIKIRN